MFLFLVGFGDHDAARASDRPDDDKRGLKLRLCYLRFLHVQMMSQLLVFFFWLNTTVRYHITG